MQNQSIPEQESILELLAQLSTKLEALEKEVKASRKETKKTHKKVKALYLAIAQGSSSEDTEKE